MAPDKLLNRIISKHVLPRLDQDLGALIKQDNLDPYANVASAKTGGSAASATASLRNLTGLSSLQISSLTVTGVTARHLKHLAGNVALAAAFGSPLAAALSASARALFVKVGPVAGTMQVTDVSVRSGGSFQATLGGKICLNALEVHDLTVGFGSVSVDLPDLGELNHLLQPLEQAVVDHFKGEITSLLSSQVTTIMHEQLESMLPGCVRL